MYKIVAVMIISQRDQISFYNIAINTNRKFPLHTHLTFIKLPSCCWQISIYYKIIHYTTLKCLAKVMQSIFLFISSLKSSSYFTPRTKKKGTFQRIRPIKNVGNKFIFCLKRSLNPSSLVMQNKTQRYLYWYIESCHIMIDYLYSPQVLNLLDKQLILFSLGQTGLSCYMLT